MVAVLRVDQQIVLVGERLAGPRVDRVRPEDDRRLVDRPAMLGDQVPIPLTVAEYRESVGGIEHGAFLRVDSW